MGEVREGCGRFRGGLGEVAGRMGEVPEMMGKVAGWMGEVLGRMWQVPRRMGKVAGRMGYLIVGTNHFGDVWDLRITVLLVKASEPLW